MDKPTRTLADVLIDVMSNHPESTPICLLHENLTHCQATKKGTKITLGVPPNVFTPDDAIWFSGDLGRPDSRKPKYIGVLVFVPTTVYEGK